MKALAHGIAWSFVAGVIVFAAANPASGVVYQSPMTALGIGLIGLGLCVQVRQKLRAQAAATASRR